MRVQSTLLQWKLGWVSHWSNWSETSETSSLGNKKKKLSGAQRENWTYFPRFCIFIISHLLCWPELWKRSSVHYFFKRSFLCFLKVCAPFSFVTKATWPRSVSLTSSGENPNGDLWESLKSWRLERQECYF